MSVFSKPRNAAGIVLSLGFNFLFLIIMISCASTPLPQRGTINVPEDFFGFVHAGISETSEEYRLLDDLGATWVLNTFYWDRIERQDGVFDFSGYDSYVDTAIREGKKVVAVLAYHTPWLFPEGKSKAYISAENIPYFLRFAEEMVRHFKGRIDVWEIWNEPNLNRFWKGTAKEFYELTKQTARRMREVDPEAYILGGAFLRAPTGYIRNMYKAGAMEDLDGLAFHPYALNPDGAMRLYDNFIKVLAEINFTRPVWITEVGYPTGGWYPTKASLNELPSYVVKTIAGAAARGARALLWYELKDPYNPGDPGANSQDSERFFGLTYPDLSMKAGGRAYALCARFLPSSRYMPELPIRENVPGHIVSFCFMNNTSGHNTLILWNDWNQTQAINLQLPAQALLHDISTGTNSPLPAETALNVGKQPLFITWQGTAVPRLSRGR
jgi:hypothetical protein